VTSNVLLATDDARLKLAATNLDIAITCWVQAKVDEDGATTVPARLLGEFVNSLPNDRIDMKLNERQRSLNLRCGHFEANVKGIDIILPARAMTELARVMSDEDESLRINVTPNRSQVLFSLANVQLVSRLIEGTFPNYRQIIPTKHTTRVVVNTKEFLGATKIASFFARDSANIVRLQATPGEELAPGKLTVAATAAEVGDTVGGIDAAVEGDEAQIAFNAKYLTDVLSVLDE